MTPRSFRIPDYLDHIVKAIDRIEKYTKDISKLDSLQMSLFRMRLSVILRLLAKQHTVLKLMILILHRVSPNYQFEKSMGCGTNSFMDTSQSTWKLSGQPYKTLFPSYEPSFAACKRR